MGDARRHIAERHQTVPPPQFALEAPDFPRSRMIKAVPMASPSSVTMCEALIANGTRRSPTVHQASCSLAASCAVRPSSTAHTPGSRS